MFIGEPPPTQFDLRFQVAGFDVRVSPFFWILALVITSGSGMPQLDVVLVGTAVIFVSILVHELGHAIAMRRYGSNARIVLYHFGGLAIPEDNMFKFTSRRSRTPHEQIVISAAGPAAGASLAVIASVFLYAAGGALIVDVSTGFPVVTPIVTGTAFDHPVLHLMLSLTLYINIWWTILNLMPVYPLDGGQISRELFLLRDPWHGVKNATILSLLVAIGLAIWGLSRHDLFIGMLFGSLAFSSWEVLQQLNGRGGFGGGRPW